MMSMRLAEGMSMARYAALAGVPLNTDVLNHLTDIGKITITGDRLAATADGKIVLNAVLRALNA
jgi:oxygen-independent coproporphyrinogen-3 oxidase